jgi:hypothetical protein
LLPGTGSALDLGSSLPFGSSEPFCKAFDGALAGITWGVEVFAGVLTNAFWGICALPLLMSVACC